MRPWKPKSRQVDLLASMGRGQITDPVAGPVTLGTVQVTQSAPARTLQAMALDTINVVDFGAVPGGGDCTCCI